MGGGRRRRALRHQRAELRALQNVRHQRSQPQHYLGAAGGRRRTELREYVKSDDGRRRTDDRVLVSVVCPLSSVICLNFAAVGFYRRLPATRSRLAGPRRPCGQGAKSPLWVKAGRVVIQRCPFQGDQRTVNVFSMMRWTVGAVLTAALLVGPSAKAGQAPQP